MRESGMVCKVVPSDFECDLRVFVINGIEADFRDFGRVVDTKPSLARHGGCGCAKFVSFKANEEMLMKYSISVEDYVEVCHKLESCLSRGRCSICREE